MIDEEWFTRPWDMEIEPVGKGLQMTATVELDSSLPLEGAGLQFSGLWWKGTLQINGQTLPAFYGGNQDVEIPVGSYLQAGKINLFSISLLQPIFLLELQAEHHPRSYGKKSADLFFPLVFCCARKIIFPGWPYS